MTIRSVGSRTKEGFSYSNPTRPEPGEDTPPEPVTETSMAVATAKGTAMHRRMLDVLISWLGLALAASAIVAGSLLTWAHQLVTDQAHTQLAAQQIHVPAKGSSVTAGADRAAMRQYAGQQLTTGAQAETYADPFFTVHPKEVGGGRTYADFSAQAHTNPADTKLGATVDTMFKGEPLRGLLLNAYAFGTVAGIAGIAALLGAAVLLIAKATTATVRRQLISVAARVTRSARRGTLRLPAAWPWAGDWQRLFTAATGPPAPA